MDEGACTGSSKCTSSRRFQAPLRRTHVPARGVRSDALSSELPAGTVRLGCEVVTREHSASAVTVAVVEGGCLKSLVADTVLLACPAACRISTSARPC